MTNVLVRFKGVPEEILENLVDRGYFATKSEAVRAGVIELGKEFNMIGNPSYYREELDKLIKKSGKKFTPKQVMKELEKIENEI